MMSCSSAGNPLTLLARRDRRPLLLLPVQRVGPPVEVAPTGVKASTTEPGDKGQPEQR